MKNRLFRTFYKIHIYLGIFVALHFVVLSLSGSVLLFKDELTGPEPVALESSLASPISTEVLFQKMLGKYPGERPLALSLEEHDPSIAQLRLGKDGAKEFRGSRRVYIDTKTGEEIIPDKDSNSFFDWLLRLHREFLLGSNGKIYVGVIGLLYVFVLISGFFIYGNFSKKSSFGEIRRQSTRSFSSDLHRFLGITTFAWGLAIGATGMFLGFSTTLIKVYRYSELQKLNEQYPTAPAGALASLDNVLSTAQKALPESTFEYLAFPDTQFSPPGHFLVLMHGNTLWTERLVELVVVDAVTGDLTEVRTLPWYLKFGMLSEPLHFGNYGGLMLKIVWLIFSMVSLSLPVFGIIIWYQRRYRSGTSKSKVSLTILRTWRSDLFQKPFAVPAILAAVIFAGLVGSFLTEGILNKGFTVILLLPLYFCLRVLVNLWRGA